MMDENEKEKVCVCFKIENGLQIHIDIPKFATAKNLVYICSEQLQINTQEYHINLTRNNIFLTSRDNGQVLEFANSDVINVSVKQKWIKLNFMSAGQQQIFLTIENGSSVKEVVEVLRDQCGIPNNYVIHLTTDTSILDDQKDPFTDGETILVFLEDKDKD